MKAFDKSDYGVILDSCRRKGICGKMGEWIANSLIDRYQAVIANNTISDTRKVMSGVPQGLVLGLLLFLLLIDSISAENPYTIIGIFADNTKRARLIMNEDDAEKLQKDLAAYTGGL